MAVAGWSDSLIASGRSNATTQLRVTHIRSVARLSRTTRPGQLTAELLAAIYAGQDWKPDYRCDLWTSVRHFYNWAMQAGLAEANPARARLNPRKPRKRETRPRKRRSALV